MAFELSFKCQFKVNGHLNMIFQLNGYSMMIKMLFNVILNTI